MNHVVIGIPTYKRPIMLRKLLNSIDENIIDPNLISKLDIIVVDNDKNESAKKIVDKFDSEKKTSNKIHYICFPKKGLSYVRNEIHNYSLKLNPDYLVTIDDDEFADVNWLNEMVKKCIEESCHIVIGTIIPVLEKHVGKDIAHWFPIKKFPENQLIKLMRTGNTLFKASFIKEHKLSFDNRFNSSGGEDTFFGMEAISKGAKILYAKNAIVYENIPEERTNLSWLLKRRFRGATTFSYCNLIQKNYKVLIKKFIVSFIYIFIGFFSLPLVLIPFKKRYWGLLKLMDGLGGLYGMMGKTFKEYA